MRLTFALLVLAISGCYLHREYDRNGPGLTDLAVPPTRMLEMPTDPGRQGLIFSGGLLGSGGWLLPNEGATSSVGRLQAELSADYFRIPTGGSEEADSLPPLTGINLGYTALTSDDALRHQLYAELQHTRDLVGIALGWTYQPVTAAHGPQATLSYGPVYLRGGLLPGTAGTVEIGFALKGYVKLSWFR
jgi:hypothetical protein